MSFSGFVITVPLICFVLIFLLTACKGNTDTNTHLTGDDLSMESSRGHMDETEFEQPLVDPYATPQSDLVSDSAGESLDKVEIEQTLEFTQADVDSKLLVVGLTDDTDEIDNKQISEILQTSVESDFLPVVSIDVPDNIDVEQTPAPVANQANIDIDLPSEKSTDVVDNIDVEQTPVLNQTSVGIDLLSIMSTDVPDNIDFKQTAEFTRAELDSNLQMASSSDLSIDINVEEIQQINQPPSAVDDIVSVIEDQIALLNGLLNNDQDLDEDNLKIVEFSLAQKGFVELVNDDVLKYIPSPDFNGRDVFTYTISDGNGGKSTAQVVVNVDNVNDTPIAKSDSYIFSPGEINTMNVIVNDEGLGDDVKLSILVFPEYGNLELLNNNELVFTPKTNYFGLDNFLYQLEDSDGETSAATVQLNVECLNECTRVFNLSWEPSISLGVAAYRVYVGKVSDQLYDIFDLGDITYFDYTANQKGEYFFAISAFDDNGIESELSGVIKGVF